MFRELFFACLLPPAYLALSSLWRLGQNYLAARRLGIPCIVMWVSIDNPAWMLLSPYIRPFLRLIPFYSSMFAKFDHVGWEYEQKKSIHRELGDAFVIVTPSRNWVQVCNAETVIDVFQAERQQQDFERPTEMLEMLGVFGPCISTARGSDWQRHRKCTATSFNDRSNRLVWTESLRQAKQMLQHWTSMTGPEGIRTSANDTRTLTLDVLLSVGFGKSYDFRSVNGDRTSTNKAKAEPLNYRDALGAILDNTIPILALGPKLLSRISFPSKLAYLGQATTVFKQYMVELFEETRKDIQDRHQGGQNKDNLVTSLIRASIDEKQISQDEVFGNMFVFSFAGHDTTTHTMTFTLLMLAAHPEVQEWMAEEIQHVLEESDDAKWSLESCSRLNRCLAVLLETLRIYNPLLSLIKTTKDLPAELTVGIRKITVPPSTRLGLNIHSIQSHPRYWGPDSDEWKPSRWIRTAHGDGDGSSIIDREYLITPPRGTYFPWSESRHVCPGKRFAQVEHVAVMAALFREHRVAPVLETGEDEAAARRRVQGVAEDCEMRLLLQVRRPEMVGLVWKRVA